MSGLSCLSDLPQQSLAPLLTSEGFAGHITVQNSQCTWHRAVNWHGVPGRPDTGLMSLAKEGLVEDGVHAEYRELWQAVPEHDLNGMRVRFGDMTGVLISSDQVFLLGIGPTPQGTTERLLADLAEESADRRALRQVFESEYVMGVWDGTTGRAQMSTNPFQEGQIVLERADGFVWHARSFDGVHSARRLEVC